MITHVNRPSLLLLVSALSLLTVAACGASLPERFVVERDVDAYLYRRYQKVLDVEFAPHDNPGVGHTATYVRRGAGNEVADISVFVTRYRKAASLTAEIGAALRTLASYRVSVVAAGGGHAWSLDGMDGDKWLLWVSGRFVVKVGGAPGEAPPEEIVDAYMDLYPSDLDEDARALEDSESAGPAYVPPPTTTGGEAPDDVPDHLREGAPR